MKGSWQYLGCVDLSASLGMTRSFAGADEKSGEIATPVRALARNDVVLSVVRMGNRGNPPENRGLGKKRGDKGTKMWYNHIIEKARRGSVGKQVLFSYPKHKEEQ